MIQKSSLFDIKFPRGTTDEEKIVWATTHWYTTREIKKDLKFGNTKISRVMKEYRETQTIPKTIQRHPPIKLTNDMLLHIPRCISKDAHTTSKLIQKSALEINNMNVAQSTISNG